MYNSDLRDYYYTYKLRCMRLTVGLHIGRHGNWTIAFWAWTWTISLNSFGSLPLLYLYVISLHTKACSFILIKLPHPSLALSIFYPTIDLTIEVQTVVSHGTFFFYRWSLRPNWVFECAGDAHVEEMRSGFYWRIFWGQQNSRYKCATK